MTALPLRSTARQPPTITLALATLLASGCVSPLMTDYLSGSRRQEVEAAATPVVDPVVAKNDPKTAALRKATGQQPTTPEEALALVIDDLQEIGDMDPVAQQQLLANLKAAKPDQYGPIVKQFKGELAYRHQLASRDVREQMKQASAVLEAAAAQSGVAAAETNPAAARVVAHRVEPSAPRTVAIVNAQAPADNDDASETPTEGDPNAVQSAAAVVPARRDQRLQHAAASEALAMGSDWQAQLDSVIADLERTVRPQPATVAELHDHFRLRVLQLLAGRDEEAYRPIPGASPVQHDYWSKQLFSIASYLKTGGSADDKQRAAAALVHLDEARASLAELATLQIRNLAFVESVEGFGAYQPIKRSQFDPGAAVMLYAEVENFASASTLNGYETILATSYQVVDAAGKQIDGAKFPDVTDVCRGRRRDFHLQYGVTLPTRISPGEYRLVITITDQRSGKIGHGELGFEINPER